MKQLSAATLAVLMLCVSGCADSHDKVTADSLAVLKEFNDVLDTVTDEASAEAARGRLERLSRRMEGIQSRQEKLGDPTPEQQKSLESKYAEDMAVQLQRLMPNMFRIAFNPALSGKLGDVLEGVGPKP